jgi:hypothetical protein
LDFAFREAQAIAARSSTLCPVFLFFSVSWSWFKGIWPLSFSSMSLNLNYQVQNYGLAGQCKLQFLWRCWDGWPCRLPKWHGLLVYG